MQTNTGTSLYKPQLTKTYFDEPVFFSRDSQIS